MAWGLILLAVGALFVALAAFLALRARRFLKTAVSVQGNVVGFEEQVSTDADGNTTSSTHAVVEFATAGGGKSIRFTEKSQTFGGLSEGEPVPVKYDPSEPERARIDTPGRIWIAPIVTGVIGFALIVPGVIMLGAAD